MAEAKGANGSASFIRNLFGGAMKAVIPSEAKDVSELREIPDNQEVFCHPVTDQSIMIDILEYQNHVHEEQAAKYHFDDIANSNESLDNYEIKKIEAIPLEKVSMKDCSDVWLLRGRQFVSKFKEGEEAKNIVEISLALFRLPQHSTDIVVTFNNPTFISQSSSSNVTAASALMDSSWTEETFYFCVTSLALIHPDLLFGENT